MIRQDKMYLHVYYKKIPFRSLGVIWGDTLVSYDVGLGAGGESGAG